MEIELLYKQAKERIYEYIDMLYIQSINRDIQYKETDKKLNVFLIEKALQKRGYVLNAILGKPVFVKGFTCVYVTEKYVEVWHDTKNRQGSVFINTSILTGLPITLNYMERI